MIRRVSRIIHETCSDRGERFKGTYSAGNKDRSFGNRRHRKVTTDTGETLRVGGLVRIESFSVNFRDSRVNKIAKKISPLRKTNSLGKINTVYSRIPREEGGRVQTLMPAAFRKRMIECFLECSTPVAERGHVK